MDYLAALLAISGVLVLSVVSPGPNFAIVTSTATLSSRRAGVATGLGLAAASATWALLAVAGLGLIVSQVEWLYLGIKLAGAAYLIWLGGRMILGARKPPVPTPEALESGVFAAARKGYLVSMTNPKALAFYGSIFAVMVPVQAPVWFHAAIVVIAAGFSGLWYCSMALLFSSPAVRSGFMRFKAVFETLMGVFLLGLGGRLLLSR
ncbi:LysE family transporter [Pseudomonas sp. JS3066]|uniref:LysE family translocator n=1 Tax=Pseudomonas sp. JS3066 TaxID=3090665 RepID=UPI002E7B1AEA|nr:LysE family transporter [Pseudomonas sp. JS3066]WVK96117.1 LysE family transporter [Pseudomonas sp. JS3066]